MIYDYLHFAKSLARDGGAILRENFGRLSLDQIHQKGMHDVVTEMDRKIEDLYAKEIKKTFPDHGIIGEEGTEENTGNEYLWILDPLDGTKNYTTENPFFCTTMCLLKNREPIVAVIYEPITHHLFYAAKDQGAYKNGQRIQVSRQDNIKKSMLLYCHAADAEAVREAERYVVDLKIAARDAARLRSAGCEMALVAKGACEAYLMNKLPLWDLAAGALIVREAGGRATDFDGKNWVPGDRNILVSNGSPIHQEILQILKKT